MFLFSTYVLSLYTLVIQDHFENKWFKFSSISSLLNGLYTNRGITLIWYRFTVPFGSMCVLGATHGSEIFTVYEIVVINNSVTFRVRENQVIYFIMNSSSSSSSIHFKLSKNIIHSPKEYLDSTSLSVISMAHYTTALYSSVQYSTVRFPYIVRH